MLSEAGCVVHEVIHAQVTDFHKAFCPRHRLISFLQRWKCSSSLLTGDPDAALHRAIISILDIALRFCNIFTSIAGNTTVTLDVSRHSLVSRRHNSRRQRARRKNVVSFSRKDGDLSSDESHQDEEDIDLEDEGQAATSFSVDELKTGFGSVDKLSSELDGLVRFVRRGVESLASGGEDVSASFSVLAFALEDWDL
ncbi:Spindle pole body component [Mycena indigotica]|uniref:Spindle pole body component n=1 Tax=Mycena indigotica TaxID=2126181 RepID=A0A8H6SMX5_9AGAR|nr:Spindle pole body component [Mycena indigotica]KAF7302269.1 Spindle pole body component [Mycena indigotica]